MIIPVYTGQRLKLGDGDYLTKFNREELRDYITAHTRVPAPRERKPKIERKQQTLWKTKKAIIKARYGDDIGVERDSLDSVSEISKKYGVRETTIRGILKRYRDSGWKLERFPHKKPCKLEPIKDYLLDPQVLTKQRSLTIHQRSKLIELEGET